MTIFLLDLPNELLEVIIWYLIGRPWTTDVCDFLSLTSTCRTLRRFAHDQRYWQMMAKRRDPTCEIPPENSNWLDYCRQSKRSKNCKIVFKQFLINSLLATNNFW